MGWKAVSVQWSNVVLKTTQWECRCGSSLPSIGLADKAQTVPLRGALKTSAMRPSINTSVWFDVKGRILLTRREEEIVSLVADGLKNREIAEHLKLSEHTVKNHLFRVFERLGISSRAELILYVDGQRALSSSASVAT
jgi:DNA-binding CsgD family transcriptional regulator